MYYARPHPELRTAVASALAFLATAYTKSIPDPEESCRTYCAILEGLEPEQVTVGAKRAATEERFFPNPAILRRYSREVQLPKPLLAIVRSNHPDACTTCGAAPEWFVLEGSAFAMPRLQVAHLDRAHGWPDGTSTLPAGATRVYDRDIDPMIRAANDRMTGPRPLAATLRRQTPVTWRSDAHRAPVEAPPNAAPHPAECDEEPVG